MDKLETKELSEKIERKKRSLRRYMNLQYKSINSKQREEYTIKIKEVEAAISHLRRQVLILS